MAGLSNIIRATFAQEISNQLRAQRILLNRQFFGEPRELTVGEAAERSMKRYAYADPLRRAGRRVKRLAKPPDLRRALALKLCPTLEDY